MSNKIHLRRGTDAERGTVVLDSGEPGWTTDTKELYVGDGATYGGILVTGGAGGGAGTLCKLSDVSCAGTVDGRALTYQAGTWVSRGTVVAEQIPGLPASKITSGTLAVARHETLDNLNGTVALAQVPTMDDGHIPDLDTLSYSGAFGTAQVPPIGAYKTTTGTFNSNRIPSLPTARISTGTFNLARIPSVDDDRIPNVEGLSYGAAFATAQIPSVGAYKIASGTLNADRIPALPTARITTGTFDVNRIDTLANLKGTVTAEKVASLPTSKITSGSFNPDRIPVLPTSRITSGTFADARIPDVGVVAINYVIDGGGAAITAGTVGFLEVPFAGHVDRWTLLADQHGSVVIDIWRDSYSNFPPNDADSMPGTTNMPAISGTVAAQGTDLSGWGTQGISRGDILVYHVDSCSSIELCTIALRVQKT